MRIWHPFVAILSMVMGIMLAAQSPSPRPTPSPGVSIPSTLPQPSATTPSTLTGIIRGQVVRADTGQPLRKAQVSVRIVSPPETRTVTTDTNGRYELKGLPPSRYAPFARRDGYALTEYGQKDPNTPGQQIELGAGQTIERIDFALRAGGAIAGRVLDEAGEPLAGAYVQAETLARGIAALDVTDDLGQFRLFGLGRGTYVVAVAPPTPLQPDTIMERRSIGPFTYYPGTLVKNEARRVQVDTGSDVTGLTIATAVSIAFTSQTLAQVSGALASLRPPPRDPASEAARTGVVRGRVTSLENGEPLRGALVSLNFSGFRVELADVTALTDGAGRFELRRLPAATYTLTESKGGFETLEYGQQRPNQPGRPIDLADGATFDVNLALPRGGVVAGRLVDEDGDPVSGATVRLLRQRYVSGQRRLSSSVAAPDTTNDRGEFRIYGIPPGTYFLSGTQAEPGEPGRPPNGLDSRDAVTTFYPGTPSPERAQPVTVAPGQEVSGLTMRSPPPPRVASISVTLPMSGGQRATLELTRLLATGASNIRRGGGPGPDGSFTWMNLPPGEYYVFTRGLLRSGEFGRARVALDGVDAKVALSLIKGGSARGRITLDADAGSQPPQPGSIRISAVSTDPAETTPTSTFSALNADMTFEAVLTPGIRLLRLLLPRGWVTKSIRAGDLDITDTPLDLRGTDLDGIEIVLTNRLTDVTGTISDASGRPTGDATVVLFADDASKWGHRTRFVAVVRPNQNGRFTQRDLPPARYVAVALEYLEPGEETNPETLKRLQSLGVRFTLADRESKTLGLTLTTLP
jgi:protocatechuate 3,4-dioxygenase beta subunit